MHHLQVGPFHCQCVINAALNAVFCMIIWFDVKGLLGAVMLFFADVVCRGCCVYSDVKNKTKKLIIMLNKMKTKAFVCNSKWDPKERNHKISIRDMERITHRSKCAATGSIFYVGCCTIACFSTMDDEINTSICITIICKAFWGIYGLTVMNN